LELERRLVMIMRDSVPCRLSFRTLLVLGIVALVVLPGWSLSQQSEEIDRTEKKAEKKTEDKEVEIKDLFTQVEQVDLSEILVDIAIGQDGKPVEAKDVDRLDKLEKQLEAMRKEVQTLRAAKNKGKDVKEINKSATDQYIKKLDKVSETKKDHSGNWALNEVIDSTQGKPVSLSRAIYKMPHAKAESLALFLRDQLKDLSLETKVEDDSIVITTRPEIQKTISQFIGLVLGKSFVFELKDSNKPAQK
jgi:hypothetical protein